MQDRFFPNSGLRSAILGRQGAQIGTGKGDNLNRSHADDRHFCLVQDSGRNGASAIEQRDFRGGRQGLRGEGVLYSIASSNTPASRGAHEDDNFDVIRTWLQNCLSDSTSHGSEGQKLQRMLQARQTHRHFCWSLAQQNSAVRAPPHVFRAGREPSLDVARDGPERSRRAASRQS